MALIIIFVNMYRKLLAMTCQVANVLKNKGVTKGDTVAIYMPAIPLAVASMLACTRIGAVHWYNIVIVDALIFHLNYAQYNYG